jgi:signal transduction histidine kinase
MRLPRPRLTLRVRLSATYAAVFLVAATALLVATVSLVDQTLNRSYKASTTADRLSRQLNDVVSSPGPGTQMAPGGATAPPTGKQPASAASTVPSAVPSGKKPPPDVALLKSKLVQANVDYNTLVRGEAVRSLIDNSLLALVVLVPLTVVVGWVLAGRVLRPVAAITESARRASETRLSERLALSGPRDEITELADTYDAMLDRLEHAFDAQRRFTADASHELRTPLTVARTAIEVVLAKPRRSPEQLEEMARDVHTALNRAERLVDSLLTLTRSQYLVHHHDEVDLATIAEDALDLRAAQLAGGVTVRTELGAAPAIGDRALLDQLVGNLVDNAIRHNVPDGWLAVSTGRGADGPFVTVANSGPVIDPERVPGLFEPFQRAGGRARSGEGGLGLGLAIVRSVANAHHAEIESVANPAGGLTVTISLPDQGASEPT